MNLRWAHKSCQRKTELALSNGWDVVVANTFLRWSHLHPYLNIAYHRGALVRILVAKGEYANVHGVPDATIDRMRKEFQV